MKVLRTALVAACPLAARPAAAQPADTWEILDNSFLVEEAFNQERGIFQNIFSWTRTGAGAWQGSFTQEWPAPAMRHQLSYTIPFSRADGTGGVNDTLLNYRFQLMEEGPGRPAMSPRLSLSLPTGNEDRGRGAGALGLQINVPASKQFGNLYVHGNAGLTWIHDVERTPFLAGSAIWRAWPMFNLMLEAVGEIDESFTISPGFRRGWNFGDRQLVVGLALPVTRSGGSSDAALLTYFSYELPFRKSHYPAERTEIEVEVLGAEPELRADLADRFFELHQRRADRLDFLPGQRLLLHPPDGLALHQLAQEFDDRQHQLGDRSLHGLGLRFPAHRRNIALPPAAQLRAAGGGDRAGGHGTPPRRTRLRPTRLRLTPLRRRPLRAPPGHRRGPRLTPARRRRGRFGRS
jgi:hypothetical protein